MNSLDIAISNYFSLIRTQPLTEFMYLVSTFFDVSFFTVLICLCVALLVYIIRGKKYSYLFLGVMMVQAGAVLFLKNIFNVARPTDAVINAFGQSFPSYHATAVTVFFTMLMYIFDSHFKTVGRIIFNSICVSLILLVVSSRIYLGVHWLSDVLGGVILGITISYLSVLVFKKIKK